MRLAHSAIVISAALVSACALPKGYSVDEAEQRQHALRAAKEAIAQRGWSLPRDHRVTVRDSWVDIEFQPAYEIYDVAFSVRRGHQWAVIYHVHVNKRSGRIEDVHDDRRSMPLSGDSKV